MKVGLVSYHSEPNYGTMLQAYALSEALSLIGVKSEYIQYINIPRQSVLFKIARRIVRTFIPAAKGSFDFFDDDDFKSTKMAFEAFHTKYIPISENVYYSDTIRETNDLYDKFIVGSDQTWSEYMNRFPTSANLLEFVEDSTKKASYAPSIGSLTISDGFKKRLIKALASFSKLSCREEPNAKLFTTALGKKMEYVADPTLLLTRNDWDKIAVTPSLPPKKYILAYILGEKECISDFAESLGNSKGMSVYYILTRPKYLTKNNCLKGVGPADFIGLIRDAAYVVTDSFHGTAFCLNYGTIVYCFNKRPSNETTLSSDNDRIRLLLDEFGLGSRLKRDTDSILENDYSPEGYAEHLNKFRESSWRYLKSIIE